MEIKTYIVGIYNGRDVDDYYVSASSKEEAIKIAEVASHTAL